MDPVTISLAVGVASKAFSAIKQGFAVGRDIEQMSGDIGRWMGAVSDVDNAEKQRDESTTRLHAIFAEQRANFLKTPKERERDARKAKLGVLPQWQDPFG